MQRLFRQFSAPGGIPSHVSVTTPGSIHEGGELGYVLVHAFGAVMDNPDLLALAVVGDGEAETGPLEGSWKGISFLNPRARRRGAADPAPQRRQDRRTDRARPQGPGRGALAARGPRLRGASRSRATTCPACTTASPRRWPRRTAGSAASRRAARGGDWDGDRPRWPMIVLRTPEGLDRSGARSTASRSTGTWRSHQVPLSGVRDNPEHLRAAGDVAALVPAGGALRRRRRARRAGPAGQPDRRPADERVSPHANGGLLTRDLDLPDFRDYAVDVDAARRASGPSRPASSARCCARSTAATRDRFRLFCPDETNSNRLGAVFEVSDRAFMERVDARRRADLARRPGDGGAVASTTATAGSRATP